MLQSLMAISGGGCTKVQFDPAAKVDTIVEVDTEVDTGVDTIRGGWKKHLT